MGIMGKVMSGEQSHTLGEGGGGGERLNIGVSFNGKQVNLAETC